jgi:hypothetical protein
MEKPLVIGKPSGPRHATFACTTYRAECEAFERDGIEPDETSRTGDGCTVPFVDDLPPLFEDLPACPYCDGPSLLLELLAPVAG